MDVKTWLNDLSADFLKLIDSFIHEMLPLELKLCKIAELKS